MIIWREACPSAPIPGRFVREVARIEKAAGRQDRRQNGNLGGEFPSQRHGLVSLRESLSTHCAISGSESIYPNFAARGASALVFAEFLASFATDWRSILDLGSYPDAEFKNPLKLLSIVMPSIIIADRMSR